MAEEAEESGVEASAAGADPFAAAMALSSASRSEADAFLRDQRRLIADQRHHLHEQLKQLRLGIFGQRLSLALKGLVALLSLAIAVGLGAAVWNAAQANGLVVEAFSVPPRLAETGIAGDVVADDITNKIAAIRDLADYNSLATSKDVSKDHAEDIKVEIPETGVSLGQAWRYLRLWFGHERQMTGNLRLAGDGKIALTVALDGADAFTLSGASGDLDKLEQQAAERVFGDVEPLNYTLYLWASNRSVEALAVADRNANSAPGSNPQSDTYSLYSFLTRLVTGDMVRAAALDHIAMAVNPKAVAPHIEVVRDSIVLGHDEEGLREARAIPGFRREDQPPQQQGGGFDAILWEAALERDSETGDFLRNDFEGCDRCTLLRKLLHRSEYAARRHDAAQARMLIAEVQAAGPADGAGRARYFADIAVADWPAAASHARAYAALGAADPQAGPRLKALQIHTRATPLLAQALARSGDVSGARAQIETTPADCYDCIRTRGLVAAAAKQWGRADYWFARAANAGPSIPFAYTDWGAALLQQGQPDVAIAKFTIANQKGPHFADPLEMWGEALMAKNQSHLALAKFEEAEKYAPNWGRLHLKWGEALAYAGNTEEAKKQFATAARLDLAAADRAELASMRAAHG